MSKQTTVDGEIYYHETYLQLANKTSKRRWEQVRKLAAENTMLRKVITKLVNECPTDRTIREAKAALAGKEQE